jgi:hypothetical protein
MPSSFPGPTLLDYLRALYSSGTPGDLLAYVKEPFFRRFGVAPNLDAYARHIEALDANYDVYLTVNTLDGMSIRSRGAKTRGLESEVVAVVAFVADVDAVGKEGHDYPPQSFILHALEDMPLRTSIIVISGRPDGGLHVYWLLLTPFLIRTDEDRKRIKRISEQWQHLLKAKLAPYELDSTFDLVRVLRPIGTVNKKYGTLVSAMVFQPDRRYRIEEFEQHLPKPVPAKVWTPPASIGSSIIDRASRYVAKIPGAIEGQGGSDVAYHAAAVLVEGFGLSIADALPIMRGWNTTCTPRWSEAELLHKLESADAKAERRGYLLADNDQLPGAVPMVNRLVLVGA